MYKHLNLKFLILIVIIITVSVVYIYNNTQNYNKTQVLIEYIEINCKDNCKINLNSVFEQDLDYFVYFRDFNFSVKRQCGDIHLSSPIYNYMKKREDCRFILGVKNREVKSLLNLGCEKSNINDDRIIFRDIKNKRYMTGQIFSENFYVVKENQKYYLSSDEDSNYIRKFECRGI